MSFYISLDMSYKPKTINVNNIPRGFSWYIDYSYGIIDFMYSYEFANEYKKPLRYKRYKKLLKEKSFVLIRDYSEYLTKQDLLELWDNNARLIIKNESLFNMFIENDIEYLINKNVIMFINYKPELVRSEHITNTVINDMMDSDANANKLYDVSHLLSSEQRKIVIKKKPTMAVTLLNEISFEEYIEILFKQTIIRYK